MAELFGSKLRLLRQRQALSQANLAERLNLASQGYIADLEAGDEEPSLDLVSRVARLFGVSVDYLLRDTVPIEANPTASTDSSFEAGGLTSTFGEKVRALRLARGFSQRELARELRLASRAYISNLEAGRKAPSIDVVVQIADLFGVTTDYLLCDAVSLRQSGHTTEGRAEDH
jgi:transcriptional regulator with XRE-family HTH domain